MKLIYLSEANLKDRLFIKDFVFNFEPKEKAVVVHAPFGNTIEDNRFVTKRLSSLLSEAMMYNNAFLASQRDFLRKEAGKIHVNTERIHSLIQHVYILLLGPVMKEDGKERLADPIEMIQALRYALEVETVTLFPANPMSPIVSKPVEVDSEEDMQRLAGIYEEEKPAIELAHQLRPSILASPLNYAK